MNCRSKTSNGFRKAFTGRFPAGLSVVLSMAAAGSAAWGQTAHPLPSTQPYHNLRYDDDFSYLKNGNPNPDFFDPVKYIPLTPGGDYYLTIGGEAREQYELYNQYPALSHTANPDAVKYRGAFEQRYQLDLDLHATPYFRVFTQYESTFEDGRKPAPTSSDRDEAAISQAFADFKLPLNWNAQATGQSTSQPAESEPGEIPDSLTFRAGRQELYYGAGRVISPGETRNTRQVFDAVKIIPQLNDWTVDMFLAKPITVRPGSFDDVENTGETIWGVYATRPIPQSWTDRWLDGAKMSGDLYYIGNQFRSFTYDQGSGGEQRNTFGARLDGRNGPWDFDEEGNVQAGRFKENDADAYMLATDEGYTFQGVDWTPRAGIRIDLTSGDHHKDNGALQTYQPLFSRGDWFGQSRFFAPSNLVDIHPTVDLYPVKNLDITFGSDTFWRTSTHDGVYRSVTQVLMVPDNNSRASYVGTLLEAQALWRINEHLSFMASYAHLFAGQFLDSASTGKDMDYFATYLQFKF
jgi:alginate export protein